MAPRKTERRAFIRHPASIPISCVTAGNTISEGSMLNISFGGLAFTNARGFDPGEILSLKISFRNAEHTLKSKVAWCEPHSTGYNLGVEFLNPEDRFKTRLIEQICYIEEYRKQKAAQGIILTSTEAAQQWIEKYSQHFPW